MDHISQKIILISIASIFLFVVAIGIILLVLVYQKKQLQYLREKEQLKANFEKELLESKLEIQEQTLKHISQYIHDNIGQILSLANLQLTAIELNENSFEAKKINKSMQLISQAISDLRDLSKTLDSDNIAKIGLQEAVKLDLELVERSGMYKASFQVNGIERRLEFAKEIIVYRIVQQALNNAIRHARANEITVIFNYKEDGLCISVSDNGKGFDLNILQSRDSQGAGLSNMISRATLIKANIDFASDSYKGTTVNLRTMSYM